MAASPTSFAEVRQAYREYLLQQGVTPESQSAQEAVIQLMSSVGEVATYCKGPAQLSEFEKEELHDVVGSLAISLSVIADVFKVDAGDAALCRIQRLRRKSNRFAGSMAASVGQRAGGPQKDSVPSVSGSTYQNETPPPPQPAAVPRGRPTIQTQDLTPADPSAPDALLSPNTQANFFPMLEVIERSVNPDDISSFGLTFCVVGHDGKLVDLIPDGRNVVVTAARWQEFLHLSRPYRPTASGSSLSVSNMTTPAATPAGSNTPRQLPQMPAAQPQIPQQRQPQQHQVQMPSAFGAGGSATPKRQEETVVRRVEVHPTRAYDPDVEAKLFSPSHFAKDLFSPHTTNMKFDVEYKVGQLSPSTRQEIYNSTSTPQAGQSPLNDPPTLLPAALLPHNHNHAQHSSPVTQVQQQTRQPSHPGNGDASPAGSPGASEDITTKFWYRVRMIETGEASLDEVSGLGLFFIIPHNGDWVELLANGGTIPVTGNNARAFVDLAREKQKELTGRLRRQASTRTLAVQNIATYNPQAELGCFSPSHFTHNLFAPHTTTTTFNVDYDSKQEMLPPTLQRTNIEGFNDPSQYVERITGRTDTFDSIMKELMNDPNAVMRFKVTYCVPTDDGKIEDLIENGKFRMVARSDIDTFLEHVFQRRPHLRSR